MASHISARSWCRMATKVSGNDLANMSTVMGIAQKEAKTLPAEGTCEKDGDDLLTEAFAPSAAASSG